MKLSMVLAGVLFPIAAFAADMSDCVQIGYLPGNVSTCAMYSDCMELHADEPSRCEGLPRTEQECAEKIARQNAASSANDILIKCPMTAARREHKNSAKDVGVNHDFMTANGTAINPDDLGADNEFVYYTRISDPLTSFFSNGNKDIWYVIGPRDKNGANATAVE